jgi:anthranilate synthase component 1
MPRADAQTKARTFTKDAMKKERMFYPSLETFKEMTRRGTIIPVYAEILADMDTPVSAYKKMGADDYSFLLESIEGGEKWARYSFIGFEPALIFRSKGTTVELLKNGAVVRRVESNDPLGVLRDIMQDYVPVDTPGLPRFCGGAVG